MEKKIIIKIAFNTLGFTKNSYTAEWIAERMKIFQNYTLQSLKHQDNHDFLVLVEYEHETESLVHDELKKYPELPSNVLFVVDSDFYITKVIRGYKYLYIVRLDSDDMYHTNFISMLHKHRPTNKTAALINQKGYIYDIYNQRLGAYYACSPPFYTLIYRTVDYAKGFRYSLPNGHPDVINLKHEVLPGENYMVTVHSRNTETVFDNVYYMKAIINDANFKESLLANKFGVRRYYL